jgi:hypothetical protein
MRSKEHQQYPDPHKRTGLPNPDVDPKNPWHKPLDKGRPAPKDQRNPEPEISSEQPQQNTPSGESRMPITNHDEQKKATNVDDNNNPNDEGAL